MFAPAMPLALFVQPAGPSAAYRRAIPFEGARSATFRLPLTEPSKVKVAGRKAFAARSARTFARRVEDFTQPTFTDLARRSPMRITRVGTRQRRDTTSSKPNRRVEVQPFQSVQSWLEGSMCYAVVIEKAGDKYSAYVRDLPGCIATGATVPETEMEIRDAIRFHIEGLVEDGLPVPEAVGRAEYIDA